MVPDTDAILRADASATEIDALCATARWCYGQGWVPATSGNFSVRQDERILITPSGLDKGKLTPRGLLEVDMEGRAVGPGARSAEAGLDTGLYRGRPEAAELRHGHL